MLPSFIALDASMTASEAIRRLAMHGFWLSIDVPEVAAYLEAWVEHIQKMAMRTPVLAGDFDEPVDVGYATNPEDITVADAAAMLAQPLDHAQVVIRRQDGVTVFWYTRRAADVLRDLGWASPEANLVDALNLHEYTSNQSVQLATFDEEFVASEPDAPTVLLAGQTPVGVHMPSGVVGSMRGGDRGGATPAEAGFESTAATRASPIDEVRAYPSINAPPTVAIGKAFDVIIGLADTPVTGVVTRGPLVIPTQGRASVPVDVRLVADGFMTLDGWQRTMDVTVARPTDAKVAFRLEAVAQDAPVRLTSLIVHFSVNGVSCGVASKHIVVERVPGASPPVDDRGQSWLDAGPPPPALGLSDAVPKPDIEVDILKPDGNLAKGRYKCLLANAHGIPVPAEADDIDLGDDAKTFAKTLIDQVRLWSGQSLVDNLFDGIGAQIRQKLPQAFWDLLASVAAQVHGRPVTLQLNSAEPYVPWELAVVEPLVDPSRPKILAAQVSMGRWISGDSSVTCPPKTKLTVRAMAVMAGMYNEASGLRSLPQAIAEASALATTYATLPVVPLHCSPDDLKRLLDADLVLTFQKIGGAQAIHIAAHGEVDPKRPESVALYLDSGAPLTPLLFRQSALGKKHAPFIFLNACMVGTGGEMLGDFGGFPGNCLAGGFSGLLAPLWAVNDAVAKVIALRFYEEVFDKGRTVADVIRDLRAEYKSSAPVATYLAYVFYGHPHLKLERA